MWLMANEGNHHLFQRSPEVKQEINMNEIHHK